MLNRLTSFRRGVRYLSSLPYQGNNVLGIVREGFSQWERRSPLCPHHVKQLVKQGKSSRLVSLYLFRRI
jgi:hypothetical protein